MAENEQQLQLREFKDRSTGLVVFGILQVFISGFCALMVPMMLVGVVLSAEIDGAAGASMSAQMVIPAVAFYCLLAAWFAWMGIGSILARRWARALTLVLAWMWLIWERGQGASPPCWPRWQRACVSWTRRGTCSTSPPTSSGAWECATGEQEWPTIAACRLRMRLPTW